MIKKITILGAGSWGITLARLLANKNFSVTLWEFNSKMAEELKTLREHRRFLPGVQIPLQVKITNDLEEALYLSEALVLAVPSQVVRSVCKQILPYLSDTVQLIINGAKGLEVDTSLRLSEVVSQVLPEKFKKRFTVISGPSHAEEVSREMPTAVVVSGFEQEYMRLAQQLLTTPFFRVYINEDLIGVELGGALKNIIAIGAGISDGLGFGDNTKAALITRGLAEITRLGIKLGAQALTFAGLAGLGDLVVTCTSHHSRNRNFGEKIGKGISKEKALQEIGMVVEGIPTTRAAYKLALGLQVDVPITEQVYKILFEGKAPAEAVPALMLREPKFEN